MGKHQLMGTPSRYDAICTQLCRDLKAKAVILMVVEGREQGLVPVWEETE